MEQPVFATNELTFAYGDVVALADLTVEVPPGIVGLVGANGAGKTTLLRVLLGILTPDRGEATVLGHAVDRDVLAVRERLGFMPEDDCLPPQQTAADFVGLSAELAGIPPRAARQRASEVLTLVGLEEERFRPMGEFSTGMAQRTKLAQVLVGDPDLVLLDEPTAGLDPEGRVEMLDLIDRIKGFGMSAVVSSHLLGDIEQVCDWVVMIDGGRLLRSGPIASLESSAQAGSVEVEVLAGGDDLARALVAAGATVEADGHALTVTADDPFVAVRDALAATGATLRRLGGRTRTLEDLFLSEESGS